ncbi:nitronate monooxygenase [Gracilibacillus sp. S3-1-1]|uniref:Nitronate monooxygenase n=1 Tax=Gracilibacillus pellucidus TaxID=3095368 RepID=A0ACC6M200_9BACI|nr:nitronate monooxygenase [Gracilibacillus sp. S3-1-1]MDX8044969.1 nitronate monooxygenase [Gracilibacillus sp. S3-1-1]
MLNNEITERFKIKHPIIQAPMAGGVTTSELVAEVSNNGGLGMIGAGYMTPIQIRKQIRELKNLISNPFGINLFVPKEIDVTLDNIKVANQLLDRIREKVHLPQKDNNIEIPAFNNMYETFMEQIKVVIEENVPICSFTFGIPPEKVISELKKSDIILMGTATTVREAVENEKAGMDIVIVQGSEAGGHRGSFSNTNNEGLVGSISLIPQVVDNISIPVVAAGGIMDGRGLMAAICLGAKGVQMGTAFLTCMESGAHKVHKDAVINATEEDTVLTRSFSGKLARAITNNFIMSIENNEQLLPDFPVQNKLTQDIRKAAATNSDKEFMSLWSGQSPRLAKQQTVKMLINNIMSQAETIKTNM